MSAAQVVDQMPTEVLFAICAIFYALSVVVTVLATRWAARSAPSLDDENDEFLDAYDLVYLAGGLKSGYKRVLEAAYASLFVRRVVGIGPGKWGVIVQDELPGDVHAAERAVYEAAVSYADGDKARAQVSRNLHRTVVTQFDRLKAEGHLVPDSRICAAKCVMAVPWSIGACVCLLLFLNASPQSATQETAALAFFLNLTLMIGCFDCEHFHLTQKGRRTVATARERYAALCPPDTGPLPLFGGRDVVLSVGLFGLDKWRQGPLAELYSALNPQPDLAVPSAG